MIEKTDIGNLKGIGEKTKKLFEKINVHTVGDLIRYYPHGYDVYEEAVPISELEEDKIQTVTGAIYGRVQVSGSSRMQVTTLHVKDLTDPCRCSWQGRGSAPRAARTTPSRSRDRPAAALPP